MARYNDGDRFVLVGGSNDNAVTGNTSISNLNGFVILDPYQATPYPPEIIP